MANNVRVATTYRNAIVDQIGNALDNGYLRIYDGAQPANANTALGAQVLLAELRYNAAAFPAASAGSAAAAAITADTSANASGTATWARSLASDGTTVVFDCEVGTSGADINFNSVGISAGANVSVSALTLSVAA
jgi:hypothetical protein